MKKFAFSAFVIILIAIGVTFYQIKIGQRSIGIPSNEQNQTTKETSQRVEVLAEDLEIPWEIVHLSNGDILVTERPGRFTLISNGEKKTLANIEGVNHTGEGGLMGMALHPNFESNNFIYFYYTYESSSNDTKNRVVRYKFQNNNLSGRKIIVDNIPGAIFHNGGRIKFGPDNFLYITTGDSLEPSLAQERNSLAGKILRVTDEGQIPSDNPFNNAVYSYGHRNPQGLAWDSEDRLWATEHGNSTKDEVNIIVKGKNYGWPTITGDQVRSGMETPFAHSGSETWAPGGAEFIDGDLYFGGLRGQALFGLNVVNGNAIISKYFLQEFGRIRAVSKDSEDFIYISTSNRDGRGSIQKKDDKILKIDPDQI